jgi:hypothetical protein
VSITEIYIPYLRYICNYIIQLVWFVIVLRNRENNNTKFIEFCCKFEQIYRWEEVEEESGTQLVYNTGGVQLAKKDEMAFVIDQYAKAMSENNIR